MFEKVAPRPTCGTLEEIAKSIEDKNGGDTLEVRLPGRLREKNCTWMQNLHETLLFYRLALTGGGNSASGDYRAFLNEGEIREGHAEGVQIGAG